MSDQSRPGQAGPYRNTGPDQGHRAGSRHGSTLTSFGGAHTVETNRTQLRRPGSTIVEEEPVLATTARGQAKRKPGGARPPSSRPTPQEQALQREAREALSAERASKRKRDTRTREQRLASQTMLDYNEAAEILDLQPQTVRDKVHDRNLHIREEGGPRPGDIPEPQQPFGRPRFPEGELRRWAVKFGYLSEDDALTPTRPTPPGRPPGSKNQPKNKTKDQ